MRARQFTPFRGLCDSFRLWAVAAWRLESNHIPLNRVKHPWLVGVTFWVRTAWSD